MGTFLLASTAALAATTALAQTAVKPTAAEAKAATTTTADPQGVLKGSDMADAPPPKALPAPPPIAVAWDIEDAKQLLSMIKDAPGEGLDTKDYQHDALVAAIAGGEGEPLNTVANKAALQLARDFAFGRLTGDKAKFQWFIERSANEAYMLPAGLAEAVKTDTVAEWIGAQRPQNRHYAAMRTALAETTDKATRDMLRANMERWRWMPRTLGTDYVYVNVPTYQLWVVQSGKISAIHNVVVGAKATPTPQLAVPAGAVTANPSWHVPQSIIKSSGLRPGVGGYEYKPDGRGGYLVRQLPGPKNALGKMKVEMYNPHAIYLHDTPAKALFAKPMRAASHGCIRVQYIDQLAARLAGEELLPALQKAQAQPKTVTLPLKKNWPVWLVYFTAEQDADGKLVKLSDPYGRDAQVVKALDAA
ncbi:MAG TPA: L,D-transpeptidase family protein [Sphingomonadaceae bacterium]|nr:L,D-transpeptidase family protein [Sphingomonadaceae bacterium]